AADFLAGGGVGDLQPFGYFAAGIDLAVGRHGDLLRIGDAAPGGNQLAFGGIDHGDAVLLVIGGRQLGFIDAGAGNGRAAQGDVELAIGGADAARPLAHGDIARLLVGGGIDDSDLVADFLGDIEAVSRRGGAF